MFNNRPQPEPGPEQDLPKWRHLDFFRSYLHTKIPDPLFFDEKNVAFFIMNFLLSNKLLYEYYRHVVKRLFLNFGFIIVLRSRKKYLWIEIGSESEVPELVQSHSKQSLLSCFFVDANVHYFQFCPINHYTRLSYIQEILRQNI